mgnify:CR=1 FL=1
MSSYYRQSLELYLKELDVIADNCLDIGGSAYPVSKRVKSWDVKNYKIMDNNQELGWKDDKWRDPEYTYDLNRDVKKHLSFNDKQELTETFDLIFCLEVFDYIWHPIQALENIHLLLKDGGRAVITFPFIYPVHQPVESDSLRYTEFGIQKICTAAKLKITNMIPRETPNEGLLREFYSADKMHLAKQYDHSVLGWIVEVTK